MRSAGGGNLFKLDLKGFRKKNKLGFTLAEVLITLGIIGVVAAMTIPNLISSNQKRVIETRLKEDYSIIQQMMRLAEESDTPLELELPNDMAGTRTWFQTFFAPYVKYNIACFNEAGCWHRRNPTKTLAGNIAYCNRTGIGVGDDIIAVKLYNGSNLIIDGYGKGSLKSFFGVDIDEPSSVIVFIDANGDSPPNIIGKDIYAVVFTPNGLVPAGASESTETVNSNCSPSSSGNNAGYFCMKRLKDNGWEIPKDVWNMKI